MWQSIVAASQYKTRAVLTLVNTDEIVSHASGMAPGSDSRSTTLVLLEIFQQLSDLPVGFAVNIQFPIHVKDSGLKHHQQSAIL